MPVAAAVNRYPVLRQPADLDDFDVALRAVERDLDKGTLTAEEAVALEEAVRTMREEWIMQHGG